MLTEIVFHAGTSLEYAEWLKTNRPYVVSTTIASDRVIVKAKLPPTDGVVFCKAIYPGGLK